MIGAFILEINENKVTDFYANELLKLVGEPIGEDYARKLEEFGVCELQWFKWPDDDRPRRNWKDDIILLGKLLNPPITQ